MSGTAGQRDAGRMCERKRNHHLEQPASNHPGSPRSRSQGFPERRREGWLPARGGPFRRSRSCPPGVAIAEAGGQGTTPEGTRHGHYPSDGRGRCRDLRFWRLGLLEGVRGGRRADRRGYRRRASGLGCPGGGYRRGRADRRDTRREFRCRRATRFGRQGEAGQVRTGSHGGFRPTRKPSPRC